MSLLGIVEYIGIINILITVLLCLFTYWFVRTNYWSSVYHLPPGPPVIPYPFSLLLSISPPKDRFGQMVQLNKRYGDIACTRIGGNVTVLISTPSLVRDVLVKQANVTSNRTIPSIFKLGMSYSGGIIFSHGEIWQEVRRFTLSALRNFGMGKKGTEHRIQTEARTLCNAIAELSGKPFEAVKLINAAISNIICGITFGRRFEYDDAVFLDLVRRIRNVTTGSKMNAFITELMVKFPIISKTSLMKNSRDNLLGLKNFMYKEIEEHQKTLDLHDIRDIIDMYLIEKKRLEESGKKCYLTVEYIWTCVFDLFLGGTETTSASLLWFFLIMASNPDIQQKVVEEIDEVVGRERAPRMEDRKSMPYMDATLTEVLRFRPILPAAVPHVASKDIEINGYTIPKNTEIVMNILAIHHDPRFFDKPDEFNPNRFLTANGKTFVKNEAVAVFGAGRRICLGEQLARMEFFLFATTIMQRFRVMLPEGQNVDYSTNHCKGSLLPKAFKIEVQER